MRVTTRVFYTALYDNRLLLRITDGLHAAITSDRCASCGKKPRTKPISNLKADPSQGEYNKAQIAKALANLRENDAGSKVRSRAFKGGS